MTLCKCTLVLYFLQAPWLVFLLCTGLSLTFPLGLPSSGIFSLKWTPSAEIGQKAVIAHAGH